MGRYIFLPHTADVCLSVEAETLEEIFILALEGMNRLMNTQYEKHLLPSPFLQEKISFTSLDSASLLIDFLSEVLTLSYIHKSIFHTIDELTIQDSTLIATLSGHPIIQIEKEIKAVSYHGATVSCNKDGLLETTIIFDI